MQQKYRGRCLALASAALLCTNVASTAEPRFRLSFPADVHDGPVTGRIYVLLSRDSSPEPRLQRVGWGSVNPFFAVDVFGVEPGTEMVLGETARGYPARSLSEVPPGEYFVQGLLDVYTEFHRADGHVIWAPMDQWEGQVFTRSPGNLVSEVRKVEIEPDTGFDARIELTRRIPPVVLPPDTKWVKRIRFESELLSEFWGRPMYIGATVLLPKGYDEHPDVYYPVVYKQNHFSLDAPFSFTPEDDQSEAEKEAHAFRNQETGYQFYREWISDDFPRMIAVTFQHPTPYFDDSHAVNSANNGPYGDAIMQELIPRVEETFRILRRPYARVLTGGSTGGWISLALQAYHPEFFGGAWVLYPDSVDFRRLVLVNIYEEANAFVVTDEEIAGRDERLPGQAWGAAERPFRRSVEGQVMVTMREMNDLEHAIASRGRSGLQLHPWFSVYAPVGDDGYPKPLWDPVTGAIDRDVAVYMRDEGYDLSHYIRTRWSEIGPDLVGKLHFFCGDMDNYYLNVSLYLLEEFLESTTDPYYEGSFSYGRPKEGHFWQPWTHGELLRIMAEHITKNAPREEDAAAWKYP